MKTRLLILLLLPLSALAAINTVTFNLKDFLGTIDTLKKKQAILQPLSVVRANTTNLVTGERKFYQTGNNAMWIVTNMNEGLYRGTIYGGSYTSVFHIYIPDTNGTLAASDFLTTTSSGALETEEGTTIDLDE